MSETKMSEIIKASLAGIKDFADVNTVFGSAYTTVGGVTVIPVSKISIGFAGGGVDLPGKRFVPPQSFGGGSGLGISTTPVAFLIIKPDASVDLIPLTQSQGHVEKLFELIESAPDLIEKIKETIVGS